MGLRFHFQKEFLEHNAKVALVSGGTLSRTRSLRNLSGCRGSAGP